MKVIEVPQEVRACTVIASVSGGKDSAALILALREANVPARYVFADTGWEHPATYRHVETLRQTLGITIDVVGSPTGMVDRARTRAGFPTRMARWCTDELKMRHIRAYHDAIIDAEGVDTCAAVGVRGGESEARSKLPVMECDTKSWDGLVWRPLLDWTVQDVLEIHARHRLPMNPLYSHGYDRVGCYPCIFATKAEIARVAADMPERIDRIEALEAEFTATRKDRNAAHLAEARAKGTWFEPWDEVLPPPDEDEDEDEAVYTPRVIHHEFKPRYAHETATFFQSRDTKTMRPMGIRELADWAQTDRGGKQRVLFEPVPRGGCMRWGLCEVAPGSLSTDED